MFGISGNFRENLIFANKLKTRKYVSTKKLYFKKKLRSLYGYNILLQTFRHRALLH